MPVDPGIEISVIVTTYNRIDRLLRCLAALEEQTIERSSVEIIVVDDGSTDDTPSRLEEFVASGAIRYFRQANSGPARARNVGIRMATGRIVLFIGDDIIATPQFLEKHVSYHRQCGDDAVAILGLTEWSNRIDVTPLMKTEGLGTNFEYYLIEKKQVDPENLPCSFFYTSNVSVRRQFLVEHALFFDEDFVHAMGEDGELAYRMKQQGLRIVYRPNTLAYHEHSLTFASLCRRWRLMGQVAILQHKKHPESSNLEFLSLSWRGKVKHKIRKLAAWSLAPLLTWGDRQRWDVGRFGLDKLYKFVFEVYRFDGLLYGVQVYGADQEL